MDGKDALNRNEEFISNKLNIKFVATLSSTLHLVCMIYMGY